jgi:hydroxymethylpyrimidine/phosphomethylpyrimidine kinase
VLTVAGSDSSAGAGIQADLKTIEANGGLATTVITAVTAQNTRGVIRADALPGEWVEAQLEAIFDDLSVAAVKTGMLANAEIIGVVAQVLRARRPAHYVCDPLMRSTDGRALLDGDGVDALRREILPIATLITPNVAEAESLSGLRIRDLDDAEKAARVIRDSGAQAVLVTGGHLESEPGTDLLVDDVGSRTFRAAVVETPHTHGTGCVLAAAIATSLALGRGRVESIELAKRFVTRAIRHGSDPGGSGSGSIDPLFALREEPLSTVAQPKTPSRGRSS